jgi:hypothetical protein
MNWKGTAAVQFGLAGLLAAAGQVRGQADTGGRLFHDSHFALTNYVQEGARRGWR